MAKHIPITTCVKYRAESDDDFPFHKVHKGKNSERMKGPSGSTWDRLQLNWLGADHQLGCKLEEIAPIDRRLASNITEVMERRLNMTLEQICTAEQKDLDAFYIDLRTLLSVDPKLSLYERSSNYDGSSQPREPHTPSPSSSRSRLLVDSPPAAQPSRLSRLPEVQKLSPPSDKGHAKSTPSPPSAVQAATLPPSAAS
ncbi:MAG: hypothetical protein Q9175_004261 [Cornicularia normoerica]